MLVCNRHCTRGQTAYIGALNGVVRPENATQHSSAKACRDRRPRSGLGDRRRVKWEGIDPLARRPKPLPVSLRNRITALRPRYLFATNHLAGDVSEEIRDHVSSRVPLVVGRRHKPWRPCAVPGLERLVARPRLIVPTAIGVKVHRRALPNPAFILDAGVGALPLHRFAHLEPIFERDDSGLDQCLIHAGGGDQGLMSMALFGQEKNRPTSPGLPPG